MVSKNEIKRIQGLRKKSNRDAENCFVIEGKKIILELLSKDFPIEVIYTLKALETVVPQIIVSAKELERLSSLNTPNEMLAVCPFISAEIDIDKSAVLLDGINDPGNLGTIIRTCEWFGINQILCSKGSVDVYNPKTLMASMGAISNVNVFYTDLLNFIKTSPVKTFAADLNGTSINSITLTLPCNLLFGSESHGISQPLLSACEAALTIPKKGSIESLNLGIAAGILLSRLT